MVATATHLAALAAGPHGFAHATALATKPLLMPLLAAWAAARRTPRTARAPRGLIAALLCGWAGDVLLEVGGTAAFMAGMGCFAAGHVCYLRLFAARGAFRGTRRALSARYAGYALLWAVMIALLWPGLDPGMRVPVALYSLLLTAMAAGASGLGRAVAAGGALFLLSDTLIATGIADWPQLPRHQVAIMLTYAVAQALLAAGIPAAAVRTAPPRAAAEAAA
ncbi:lysoplasmalogenase [Streptomyces sp. V4-01]|uniref:Lysoplasmalogenase n=1 Tax=Actinacidiphila polyblastidii TaxID=3110430 RepID=A0ABU7P6G0_9ACTN|nr:lysoplasmalogenase [Streptomyces sp. V4-01]